MSEDGMHADQEGQAGPGVQSPDVAEDSDREVGREDVDQLRQLIDSRSLSRREEGLARRVWRYLDKHFPAPINDGLWQNRHSGMVVHLVGRQWSEQVECDGHPRDPVTIIDDQLWHEKWFYLAPEGGPALITDELVQRVSELVASKMKAGEMSLAGMIRETLLETGHKEDS